MTRNLTESEIKTLQPLKKHLFQIRETGTAPINLTQYKKWGLIKVRQKYGNFMGKKVKTDIRLSLTPKGQRILNALMQIN